MLAHMLSVNFILIIQCLLVQCDTSLPPEVFEFRPVDYSPRKVVSKSIFTVPIFRRCPEGYSQDVSGQCYRVLRVDEQVHMSNLMARLNKFFEQAEKPHVPATLPRPVEYININIMDVRE